MLKKLKRNFENYKLKAAYILCLIGMFIIGYGTGQAREKDNQEKYKQQINYTTNTQQGTKKGDTATTNIIENHIEPKETKTQKESKKPIDQGNCTIKGNISASGSKIYHLKGGAFYEKTTPEQCFETEQQAKEAGFRKSSR